MVLGRFAKTERRARRRSAFALVLPSVNTEAMQVFLDRFPEALAREDHAVMVLDQAGWHGSKSLVVPANIRWYRCQPTRPG
jgi:hypothetical protein